MELGSEVNIVVPIRLVKKLHNIELVRVVIWDVLFTEVSVSIGGTVNETFKNKILIKK